MQKTRNPWTEDDVALLLSVYMEGVGPLVFPPELLARHSRDSCNFQAYKRGFTNKERARRPGPTGHLSPTDAAYMAGIIDGEGYVARSKSVISVASTTPVITDWLYEKVPGSVMASPRQPSSPNHQVVYRWYVTAHEVVQWMAQQIVPWVLIEKKRTRLEEMAAGATRKIGVLNPDMVIGGPARGIPGYRWKEQCDNGHDITGLRLGQNCPGCAAIYKQRMKAKGLALGLWMGSALVTPGYSR